MISPGYDATGKNIQVNQQGPVSSSLTPGPLGRLRPDLSNSVRLKCQPGKQFTSLNEAHFTGSVDYTSEPPPGWELNAFTEQVLNRT